MVSYFNKWAAPTITAPGNGFFALTPDDVIDEPNGAFRAIYVGVAGDIAAVGINGVAVTFKNAVAGSIIPIICRRINVTNTTATNLVGIV